MRSFVSRLRQRYPAMMLRDLDVFLAVAERAGPQGTCLNADLAAATGIHLSGLSRSLQALCKHKLLDKRADPANERRLAVSVHPSARELLPGAMEWTFFDVADL